MESFNTLCAICFENINQEKLSIITDCRHYICGDCLCDGGYELDKCPICRKKLKKAFVYKNNKLVTTLSDNNCPHCFVKNLKNKDV